MDIYGQKNPKSNLPNISWNWAEFLETKVYHQLNIFFQGKHWNNVRWSICWSECIRLQGRQLCLCLPWRHKFTLNGKKLLECKFIPFREDPIIPFREDPIIPFREDPIIPFREDPIILFREDPIIPFREDPIIPFREDPIIPFREDPISKAAWCTGKHKGSLTKKNDGESTKDIHFKSSIPTPSLKKKKWILP